MFRLSFFSCFHFPAEKVESIYDRIEQTLDTINKSESCSLRRTRSLAVIREETFNDLQIGGGIRSRRSQLIPRAKLLNRSFFQNRYKILNYLLFRVVGQISSGQTYNHGMYSTAEMAVQSEFID